MRIEMVGDGLDWMRVACRLKMVEKGCTSVGVGGSEWEWMSLV